LFTAWIGTYALGQLNQKSDARVLLGLGILLVIGVFWSWYLRELVAEVKRMLEQKENVDDGKSNISAVRGSSAAPVDDGRLH
jgi:hypothetical protein